MITYFNLLEVLINTEFKDAIELKQREYLDSIFTAIDSFADTNKDIELSRRLTDLETKLGFYFKDEQSEIRLSYVKTAFYYLTSYLAERIKTPKEIGLAL